MGVKITFRQNYAVIDILCYYFYYISKVSRRGERGKGGYRKGMGCEGGYTTCIYECSSISDPLA